MSDSITQLRADLSMGNRLQRKRIRHRSRCEDRPRRERHISTHQDTPAVAQAYSSFNRSSYPEAPPGLTPQHPGSKSWQSATQSHRSVVTNKRSAPEDDATRRIRVFGGSADEAESIELCGPMLDVVLGLFGSVDYDDSM